MVLCFADFDTHTNNNGGNNGQPHDTSNHSASYRSSRRRTKYKHIYAPLIKLINEYIVTDRQRNDKKKKVKKKENKEIKSFVKYLFCATMLLSDRCLLLKYELQ